MSLRDTLNNAMKDAMKAKDAGRLATVRMILAALKDKDIAARSETSRELLGDDDILGLLGKMIKQREESAAVYTQGGRHELAAKEQDEIRVSKITTIVLGVIAMGLGITFENVNVAFMVGLAFAIAASCNFPVLLMSMMWRGMTTRGAVMGGYLGLISALLGVIFSPGVWEAVLQHPKGSAPFPYENPALFSMALAFAGIWLFSKLDNSQRALFFLSKRAVGGGPHHIFLRVAARLVVVIDHEAQPERFARLQRGRVLRVDIPGRRQRQFELHQDHRRIGHILAVDRLDQLALLHVARVGQHLHHARRHFGR